MKRILIGIAVLVLVLIVVVVALPFLIPTETYKQQITQAVKDATGRELTIDGEFNLQFGLTTSVSAEGIRFANAEWGEAPALAEIGTLAVDVELLPLLSGDVSVPRLELADATIALETDAQGRNNWDFTGAADSTAPSDRDGGESGGGAPIIPHLADVSIDNVTLSMTDARSGERIDAELVRARVASESADDPMVIEVEGNWGDDPLIVEGQVGSITAATGGGPFPVDIKADAFGIQVALNGGIADPQAARGLDLALAVNARNLSGLKAFAGDGLPTAGPLALTATISGAPDALDVNDIDFGFGNTDLAGDVALRMAGGRPSVTAKLASNRVDLVELQPAGGAEETSAGGGAADTGPDTGKVFPSDPLPLEGLSAADADIDLTIGELVTPTLTVRDAVVKVALKDGRLQVAPLTAMVADSKVDGAISLARQADAAALDVKLTSESLDLGKLITEAGVTDLLEGSASLDVDLQGSGNSVAAIMASLNGHSRVLMNEGRARTEAFDLLVGGLSSVMGSVFGSKSEWTVVECMASDFRIENGVAKSQVMLINTEYTIVSGEGDVNLGAEALNLVISPQPKSATLNVSVPVKVGGTFVDPSFTPDELAAARKIGGLLGATIFPPAAVVGLAEMGNEDNPCLKLARGEGGGAQAPAPTDTVKPPADASGVSGAAENLKQDAERAVDGITRGLRGILGRD